MIVFWLSVLESDNYRTLQVHRSSDLTKRILRLLLLGVSLAFVTAERLGAQTVVPPLVSVLEDTGSLADGLIFIGAEGGGAQGPEILDDQGRIIWFTSLPTGQVATDFRVQTYQGNPVLTWMQSSTFGATNPVTAIGHILDITYKEIATVQASGFIADQHEFQLTPQNTALIDIYNSIPADLSSIGGPANGFVTEGVVQEIDIATGKVVFEWHSLPGVALTESYAALPATTTLAAPYDYFHINSVSLDTDGNLLISSRHTWTVYKVNRTTGAIMWRLGGKKSDFALGAGLPFAWQHDAVSVDAHTIRIFDNESNGVPVLPNSRVIWVNHDDTAMTANVVQSIVHPAGLSVLAEGSAQGLANGDTFVEWGILGRYSEFDPTGQLLYDVSEAPGYSSYRGYRFAWAGLPSTSPTATALQNSDGTTAVHAVWNGATGVATWQVFGGSTPGTLSLLGSAAWNGLDTTITIPGQMNDIQVVAVDSTGNAIGTSATVAGPFPDVFPTQPVSQTIAEGGTVVFNAVATGASPTYQWRFNGSPIASTTPNFASISGINGPTLLIRYASAANAGTYTCIVTNLDNPATSEPTTLAVETTSDAGRLVNISCRTGVGTGDSSLILGFAVGGAGTSGSEPVLVRSSGPALAQFGITGFLPDPTLALVGPSGTVASNSGWAGDPVIAAEAATVGAFPWSSTSSLDSAIDVALPSGPFTAVTSGASGDGGVALAEIYDSTPPGSRSPTSPRLINLSGRAQVGTGANALIAGFVIGGTTSETVLIRGSGPALVQFDVTGTLPDPELQLYSLSSNGATLLASNDDWGGDPMIALTAASVGAFAWTDPASADCALLVTLPPGAYTANITGIQGATGVALVEIYEVP
jgi:hypothetical protein